MNNVRCKTGHPQRLAWPSPGLSPQARSSRHLRSYDRKETRSEHFSLSSANSPDKAGARLFAEEDASGTRTSKAGTQLHRNGVAYASHADERRHVARTVPCNNTVRVRCSLRNFRVAGVRILDGFSSVSVNVRTEALVLISNMRKRQRPHTSPDTESMQTDV